MVSAEDILRERWLVHGLAASDITDAPILDFGVQDTGADGATWALSNRGMAVPRGGETEAGLALAWTLRGAPHLYRRRNLAEVSRATAPFSEADAASRIYDASRPLNAAGIPVLDALRTVAAELRDIVTEPMPKGEVSSELTRRLSEPFLRWCRSCQATHIYEMPFRLAALQAGLELVPGTAPPVMQPIPRWHFEPFASADASAAHSSGSKTASKQNRFDALANFRRFYPHATAKNAAAFLDAPVRDVRDRWDGKVAAEPPSGDSNTLRLLGPFDPFLQLKDRELLVADPAMRSLVWPRLGRPGVVAEGGQAIAVWRPRAAGKTFSLLVEELLPLPADVIDRITAEGERLAAHRERRFGGVLR
jgi:hypothetical protein